MGAWGTGLYDDDTACDVRDEWLEKLKSGTPAEAATAELIAAWGGAAAEPLFWLALADTQRRWGRLESEVRERAERALAAGGGLELWSDSPPKTRAARKRVLERQLVERDIQQLRDRGTHQPASGVEGRHPQHRVTAIEHLVRPELAALPGDGLALHAHRPRRASGEPDVRAQGQAAG